MSIPILTPILSFIGEKTLWRIVRFAVIRLAKTFIGKYKPDIHAKKSRKWEWEHAWKPMIAKAKKTDNPLDDPVVDYVYHHQACYIEDGTLVNLLLKAKEQAREKGAACTVATILDALKLIELPPDAEIIK